MRRLRKGGREGRKEASYGDGPFRRARDFGCGELLDVQWRPHGGSTFTFELQTLKGKACSKGFQHRVSPTREMMEETDQVDFHLGGTVLG